MRFYNQAHRFYCGVDLHARTMYLCILDHGGQVVLHKEVPCEPAAFLEAIGPFRDGLVVACECLFCWYWLADLCQAQNITFVLGHALWRRNRSRVSIWTPSTPIARGRPARRGISTSCVLCPSSLLLSFLVTSLRPMLSVLIFLRSRTNSPTRPEISSQSSAQ